MCDDTARFCRQLQKKGENCEVFRMELMAENGDIHELAGVKREDEQRTAEYSL